MAASRLPMRRLPFAETYVYHPQKRVLEPERKASVLTKSVLVDGLPSRVLKYGQTLPISELHKPFRSIIPEVRRYGSKYDIPERTEFATALHLNMMRILFSFSRLLPVIRDLSVTHKPQVSFSWKQNGENIQTAGRPGYLVSSRNQLPVFAGDEEVESTRQNELETESPVSILIDLQSYQTKNVWEHGQLEGSAFPFPHTEIIIDNRGYETGQLVLRAINFCFARIAAFALQSGAGTLGKRLMNPLTHQAIVTNGRMFAFFCLQLNTLDLEQSDGVKNIVWMDVSLPLYKRIVKKGKRTSIERFSFKCIERWLSMLLHSHGVEFPRDIEI